jgi:hypothetical protein
MDSKPIAIIRPEAAKSLIASGLRMPFWKQTGRPPVNAIILSTAVQVSHSNGTSKWQKPFNKQARYSRRMAPIAEAAE